MAEVEYNSIETLHFMTETLCVQQRMVAAVYLCGDLCVLQSNINDAAYRDDVLTAQVVPHFDNHPFAHRPDFMDDID